MTNAYKPIILLPILWYTIVSGINHWVLKDDGRITQRIDSPFYLRKSEDLVTFLNQIHHNDHVEKMMRQLLKQRKEIADQMIFSIHFSENLVNQAKCAMKFYHMEKHYLFLNLSAEYLMHINILEHIELAKEAITGEPFCQTAAELPSGPSAYSHLKCFQNNVLDSAQLEAENGFVITGLGNVVEISRRIGFLGLRDQPYNWKFHTIASYYWRFRGNLENALKCARLGVLLAPRSHRDIALLSLGTILSRIGGAYDAEIFLTAAVEHAPEVFENQISLASALAMQHKFNNSFHHFDEAVRLNPSILPKIQNIRNAIHCLMNLTNQTETMYNYVKYIKNEVKGLKKLKRKLIWRHEKLLQQQVPLGARQLDAQGFSEALQNRGQYCSRRTQAFGTDTVLVCDFYSDTQMQLENTIDIESLEGDFLTFNEAVIRQISDDFHKNLDKNALENESVETSSAEMI